MTIYYLDTLKIIQTHTIAEDNNYNIEIIIKLRGILIKHSQPYKYRGALNNQLEHLF